jgi:hypothetical protein
MRTLYDYWLDDAGRYSRLVAADLLVVLKDVCSWF